MISFLCDFTVEHAQWTDAAPIPWQVRRMFVGDLIAYKAHAFDV
jgi:hypothetical protein